MDKHKRRPIRVIYELEKYVKNNFFWSTVQTISRGISETGYREGPRDSSIFRHSVDLGTLW